MSVGLPLGWRELRLGDATDLITKGTTPTTLGRAFVSGGINFVKAESVDSDGAVIREKLAGIDEETNALLARSQLRDRDILFSIAGVIGRTVCVPAEILPANTNQAMAIIRVGSKDGLDPRFLYYQLRSDRFLRYSLGRVVQTAQANVSLGVLRLAPILVPPLETQAKIGSVLAAYDALIENNTRRIQVLEEMAQAIYREWFVEFRYPGHGGAPLVDSDLGPIPAGWESKSFADLGLYLNGFAFKPSHWGDSGLPIVKIKELKAGVTRDTPRCIGADVPQKYLVRDGDLLFSWSADLDAYIWSGGDAWLNQHLFLVTPRDDVPKLFLFHALRERMGEFRARSQGTTMKHIKRAALSEVRVAVPISGLPEAFEALVAPLEALRLNLGAANRNLRATRDLMLPRLISGEVDVSDLNIEVGDAAA